MKILILLISLFKKFHGFEFYMHGKYFTILCPFMLEKYLSNFSAFHIWCSLPHYLFILRKINTLYIKNFLPSFKFCVSRSIPFSLSIPTRTILYQCSYQSISIPVPIFINSSINLHQHLYQVISTPVPKVGIY